MSRVMPYVKNLNLCRGAFITPSNQIILANGKHDRIAKKYCEESLTVPQKELFEKWKKMNHWSQNNREADFLICVLLFDKVENLISHSITTTSREPYTRFYNYYLMEWNIIPQDRIIYNEEKETFERPRYPSWDLISFEEQEKKSEIEEIKKHVLLKDRPMYFKD